LDVRTNTSPRTVAELNDLPIKQVGSTTIFLRDVATVSDGFALQTNGVRENGRRGVLMSILKAGNASTLSVTHAHAAEPDSRNFQVAVSEFALLHFFTFGCYLPLPLGN
jgi:multidrug efflux pump subunit AcrB